MGTLKVEEARLRRAAKRQGLILRKSPRRDPCAVDYGMYALIDPETGGAVHPHGPISPFGLTLEMVGGHLSFKEPSAGALLDFPIPGTDGTAQRLRDGNMADLRRAANLYRQANDV